MRGATAGAGEVTIIGGGIVGVATALELAERGAAVTVLERGSALASGCSAGNAGVVGATHVTPLANPESLREGLRSLAHRSGPLGIDPRPAMVPWLTRFALATTRKRHAANARVLADLAAESAELHRGLAERLPGVYRYEGFLTIHESPETMAAARGAAGAGDRVFDGAEARAFCPDLATAPVGAVLATSDAHCDPERLVAGLAAMAIEAGVQLRTGVELLGFRRERDRARALVTSAGELPVEQVVLATGAWTPAVARELPIKVPIQGGKGYHVDYVLPHSDLRHPVYFQERHIVVTPFEEDIVRVSGMLQLAGTDLTVDGARVDAIVAQATELMPVIATGRPRRVWRGLRPCTPDGVPMIGPVPGVRNVTLAAGHGMWGLQLAPVTAHLVADSLAGTAGAQRLHPLRPERFGYVRTLIR